MPHDPEATELDPTKLSETETIPVPASIHERIGPYRILQKLGEGGMGEA